MKFGAHVSIAGGIPNAPLNAMEIKAETFQMFSRSPRGGKAPEITPKVIKEFKKNLQLANITNFYIHAPYFINLASANNRIREGSISILREELERGSKLGATGLMFHIGSAKDFGREKSLKLVVEGINKILSGYKGKTQFLIENSAGAGEIIGDTFEEIGTILKKIKNKKVGVCLDTCHLFASGYDLRTPKVLNNTLNKFEKLVGLKKLKVFHLNDSLVPLNARKDRHADIGFGELGKKTFSLIINHPKLKHLDAILETPEIKIDYKKTISLLKKLSK